MKFEPTLHKLSNGITVIFDPMDIETVNMKIYIKGGSSIEQPHEYGISHFLEHMLFNGTQKYPTSKQTRNLLQDNGGTRGGSTSPFCTEYHGRILSENCDVLLSILSDIVLNPIILENDIKKECNIIKQEIKRSQDNNGRKFNGLVKKNIFSGSYLEKYDSMGTDEIIEYFGRQDLINYKNAKYTANNIIIGIGGKFSDKERILSELEQLFSLLKSDDEISVYSGKINPSIIYDEKSDKKQTTMFIGFESLYTDERKFDYENMCVAAFESILYRRLYNEVIDKLGLAYDFDVESYGDRFVGVNGFTVSMSPEKLDDMIASIAKISYDTLHKNPITFEELKRKNTMIKLGRADFFESSTNRIGRLITFYSKYNELYNPKEFDKMREKMTPEDVMKYSANYFSSPINIIAQGPKCDIDMKKIWEENFN